MKKNILAIMKYAAPFKKKIITGIILAFAGAVLKMLVPDNISRIMDYLQQNIAGEIDFGVIAKYTILATAFILASFLLNSLQSVILSSSSLKMSCLMKQKVNAKLDRLPVKFFISRNAGDIQSRVTNDVDAVSTAMSNNLASITISITTLVEGRQTESGARVSDVAEAPLALGALTDGCTLYQITGAYTMFATGGVHIKPYSYTEVYDSDGNLILQNDGAGVRMISEDSADIMTRMLENVVSSGTAKGMNISKNIAVAGKTGTSHADVDRWFIGYTPDYVCGVWYGYVDARSIGYYKTNPACDIFDTVMTAVYEETPELQKNGFTRSENVVKCLYCRDSGMLASHDCTCDPRGNRIELGYFKKGTEPQSHCETHVCVNYDAAGGGVVSDMILFDEKNVKKAALVKNYSRSFPCRVYVADAEYTYRYLSPFTDPSENENEAYFQSLEEDGQYFGLSKTEKAFNRASKYYYGDFPEKETDDIYEDVLSRVFGRKK